MNLHITITFNLWDSDQESLALEGWWGVGGVGAHLCGTVESLLQHQAHTPERGHDFPAGSQLAGARDAMTLTLHLHVVQDSLRGRQRVRERVGWIGKRNDSKNELTMKHFWVEEKKTPLLPLRLMWERKEKGEEERVCQAVSIRRRTFRPASLLWIFMRGRPADNPFARSGSSTNVWEKATP